MARPQVEDGGDVLQIWRVAANMLNKQSRKAGKSWSYLREIGWGGMDWIDVAHDRDQWRTLVKMEMNLRLP
jgi:hypothetical protein